MRQTPFFSKKGFTLIELTVVTAIILILTGIFLANYKTGEKKYSLLRAANKLAQDIRRAGEMAISTKECRECGGKVPAGYGIFFDINAPNLGAKKYLIYADTQPAEGNEFYNSSDTIVEPPYIELEKGLFIKDINVSSKKVSINFKSPDPEIKIKYQESGGEIDAVKIIIALEDDPLKTKTITINKAGLIEID